MASTPEVQAYEGYCKHSSGIRTTTEVAVKEILRHAYPNHHITYVSATSLQLADFAEASEDAAVTPLGHDALRDVHSSYKQVGSRLDDDAGTVIEDVQFGGYGLRWRGHAFVVYHLVFDDDRGYYHFDMILAPREAHAITPAGRCPAVDALICAAGRWASMLRGEIWVFDNGSWTKSRALWESVREASWDEVIMEPAAKAALIADVEGFFDSQALYRRFAVPWKRGIILHGPPGNGKTLTIRALIRSLADANPPIPSLYVKSFKALTACGGGAQASVRRVFDHARAQAPCLLVFEDLDSLVTAEVRAYFLNEVDGLAANDGLLLLGSTNHLARLDPALARRPSRFDRKIPYRLPAFLERERYARAWRGKVVAAAAAADADAAGAVDSPDGLCACVAAITEGFSFAYMKELFVTSLLILARGGTGEETEEPEEVSEEPEEGLEEKEEEEKDGREEGRKRQPLPRDISTIPIPAEYRENAFLRVLRRQAQVLLDDMAEGEGKERREKVKV